MLEDGVVVGEVAAAQFVVESGVWRPLAELEALELEEDQLVGEVGAGNYLNSSFDDLSTVVHGPGRFEVDLHGVFCAVATPHQTLLTQPQIFLAD